MLIRTAAIVLCLAVAPAAAQTFARVETHPGLGTMEHILAVADLNGDGLAARGKSRGFGLAPARPNP